MRLAQAIRIDPREENQAAAVLDAIPAEARARGRVLENRLAGGEHEEGCALLAREADRATLDALDAVVNDSKRYFLVHGEPVSENPSPGNVAGGITTLEEKSLGAVQKAGDTTVTDVLRCGARAMRPGLTVLEASGNDAVSATATLAARKPGWIDFDASVALDQGLDAAAEALMARVCAFASGEETAVERNGEREIALWKHGVTL